MLILFDSFNRQCHIKFEIPGVWETSVLFTTNEAIVEGVVEPFKLNRFSIYVEESCYLETFCATTGPDSNSMFPKTLMEFGGTSYIV